MDRNAIIGFLLIGLVLMVWMWMNAPPPPQKLSMSADSIAAHKLPADTARAVPKSQEKQSTATDTLGKYFSRLSSGEEKFLLIETENYRAKISTKGGNIQSWELKKFKTWDQYPVDLINQTSNGGDFNLLFSASDGKLIDTKNLFFSSDYPNWKNVTLSANDSIKVELVLSVSGRSKIIKTMTFRGNSYDFDATYRFEAMDSVISNFEYQVAWESGLRYAEHNSIDESSSAMAYAYAGGELTEVDASKEGEPAKQNLSGRINWIATRTKYFGMAIIPRGVESNGAFLEGTHLKMPDNGAKENYNLALKMPFLGKQIEEARFTVYLGPLDYDIVKSYNIELDKIMSLGAAWIIRPIAEYVMIPLFKFLHFFIPNYGFVLIVFSIIIKVALHPLTKTSMKSMQKMQQLQPMITELKDKYKDDPQKMQMQTMRLYKEYGVNPAGGCLPTLLQMPILYALWAVFRSTIALRQSAFIWWIHDLSIPDVITKLPFSLPIVNDEISGLALLMGITMFVQQKMSVKDPRQKAMVWMMPLMMTMLFNSFSAGLNLYYFVFNLLSIGQQAYVTNKHKDEPLKKVDEKKASGGIFKYLTKNLPNLNR